MESTIIGVYGNIDQARETQSELERSGFSPGDITLTQDGSATDEPAIGTTEPKEKKGGIRGFFRDLFGADDQRSDVALYEGAVRHGNYVLAVLAADEEKSAIATDVMNRHHPIDIDEEGGEWIEAEDTYASSPTRPDLTGTESSSTEQRIPVVEEQLKVGKRQVRQGGVRIYSRVTERPVEETVQLTEAKVSVERTPANRPAQPEDMEALKEGSFELREQAEEPVVEKTARVVEEVKVGRTVSQRQQKVADTVKRTDVEVEKLGDDDYHSHFDQNYGQSGGKYESYASAYDYGSSLGDDQRFSGKGWEASESDIRSDWEQRNPGGKWEQFKDAVKYAWDRATKRGKK